MTNLRSCHHQLASLPLAEKILVLKLGIKIGSIDIPKMERKKQKLTKNEYVYVFPKIRLCLNKYSSGFVCTVPEKTVLKVFKGVFVPTFTKMK